MKKVVFFLFFITSDVYSAYCLETAQWLAAQRDTESEPKLTGDPFEDVITLSQWIGNARPMQTFEVHNTHDEEYALDNEEVRSTARWLALQGTGIVTYSTEPKEMEAIKTALTAR